MKSVPYKQGPLAVGLQGLGLCSSREPLGLDASTSRDVSLFRHLLEKLLMVRVAALTIRNDDRVEIY